MLKASKYCTDPPSKAFRARIVQEAPQLRTSISSAEAAGPSAFRRTLINQVSLPCRAKLSAFRLPPSETLYVLLLPRRVRCRLQKRKQRPIGKKSVVWRPSSCEVPPLLLRPLPSTPASGVERLWREMPHRRPQEALGVLRHRGEGDGLPGDLSPVPKTTRVLLPHSRTTSTAPHILRRRH